MPQQSLECKGSARTPYHQQRAQSELLILVKQSGEWGLKNPQHEHCISSIYHNSRKNNGQAFSVTFALRLYNSFSHAHAPRPHMWLSPGPRPNSKCFKTAEVRWSCEQFNTFMWRVKYLSVLYCHWQNPRVQQYKSKCVSALICSLPCKMARACREFQHPGGLIPMSPDSLQLAFSHWVMNSYWSPEKHGTWLVTSLNLEAILCLQDCHSLVAQSWISRPNTIYQNTWPQTLIWYML